MGGLAVGGWGCGMADSGGLGCGTARAEVVVGVGRNICQLIFLLSVIAGTFNQS